VSNTAAIRLTTARYYTPSGESIQGKGITPDIEVALARIEKLDGGNFREENLKGALDGGENQDADAQSETEDDEPFDQSKVDFQLARALDLIRGISVFESIKSPS
jgi:carboxyl-terminal processing protease